MNSSPNGRSEAVAEDGRLRSLGLASALCVVGAALAWSFVDDAGLPWLFGSAGFCLLLQGITWTTRRWRSVGRRDLVTKNEQHITSDNRK